MTAGPVGYLNTYLHRQYRESNCSPQRLTLAERGYIRSKNLSKTFPIHTIHTYLAHLTAWVQLIYSIVKGAFTIRQA